MNQNDHDFINKYEGRVGKYMVTISLINMKGGVGKTTLGVNLGWNLARRKKKKVLIIDLDPSSMLLSI